MGDMTDDILAECEHEEFQTAVAADPSIVDPIIDTPEGPLFAHELEGQGERQFYPGGVTVDPPRATIEHVREDLARISGWTPALATITGVTIEGEMITETIPVTIPVTEHHLRLPVCPRVPLNVSVRRFGRRTCSICGRRRLLYEIDVRGRHNIVGDVTVPVCAECLGIRP